jgi:TRAP-type C4-dicarboxylate transport system permease small subunit
VLGLALASGLIAGSMMLLTVVDVIGRNAFNRPLIGAFEATELGMAAVVFLALPFVTWRREQITVTLFYERASPWAQSLSTAASELIAAIICGLLAWRAWLYGERLLDVGERTMELAVPRGLVPTGVALVLMLTAFLLVVLAVRSALFGERAQT